MTQSGRKRWQWGILGVAVLAFAVVVTDRVKETFQADDSPESTAGVVDSISPAVDGEIAGQAASSVRDQVAGTAMSVPEPQAMPEIAASVPGEATPVSVSPNLLDLDLPEAEALVTLESLFGSPVVLVSVAEPSYVMTADERRFDVGSEISDSTLLAGVTNDQLILEQSGDLLVLRLPEPTAR